MITSSCELSHLLFTGVQGDGQPSYSHFADGETKLTEVESLGPGLTATRWLSWDLSAYLSACRAGSVLPPVSCGASGGSDLATHQTTVE